MKTKRKLNCVDCKKEIDYLDAAPHWDLENPDAPKVYSCKECLEKVPIATENQLMKMFLSGFKKRMADESNQK
jgi:hypothetical protein